MFSWVCDPENPINEMPFVYVPPLTWERGAGGEAQHAVPTIASRRHNVLTGLRPEHEFLKDI
jgi:hypothetical protein